MPRRQLEVPTQTPPAHRQLMRLAAFAKVAWGDEREIRFGFNLTKAGVRIYVKQVGGKNSIDQTGDTADGVVAAMEQFFCILGAHKVQQLTTKQVTAETIREIVDRALFSSPTDPSIDGHLAALLQGS